MSEASSRQELKDAALGGLVVAAVAMFAIGLKSWSSQPQPVSPEDARIAMLDKNMIIKHLAALRVEPTMLLSTQNRLM